MPAPFCFRYQSARANLMPRQEMAGIPLVISINLLFLWDVRSRLLP